jgi:hypothetical protein
MYGSNEQRGKASESNANLPGYLTATKKPSSVLKTTSSPSNPYETRSDFTGEGGKHQSVNTKSENYPPGNATNKAQASSGGTGWCDVDGKRPKTDIAYNAWDNVGHIHRQYRAPSQSTALTGSNGIPTRPDAQSESSGLAGEWAKQNPARPVSSGRASAWPKPVSFAA